MIELLKFIEELELLHKMLTVDNSIDDDPRKIFTRGKIRELLAKYKKIESDFDIHLNLENESKLGK